MPLDELNSFTAGVIRLLPQRRIVDLQQTDVTTALSERQLQFSKFLAHQSLESERFILSEAIQAPSDKSTNDKEQLDLEGINQVIARLPPAFKHVLWQLPEQVVPCGAEILRMWFGADDKLPV